MMGLNKSKGNMYDFVTHTWNTIKGECYHDCSYCYMKRWGKLNPVRFDEKELKTDLGTGNYIFVGSSCDMFAENIPDEWIVKTLHYMQKFDCKYLLQTKNPARIFDYIDACVFTDKCTVCTTIETDREFPNITGKSPNVFARAAAMGEISEIVDTYVTIEPIMDFNLDVMVQLIKDCRPKQVNIGADSGKNGLPEPSGAKVLELISELEKFTTIHKKNNLSRLIFDKNK